MVVTMQTLKVVNLQTPSRVLILYSLRSVASSYFGFFSSQQPIHQRMEQIRILLKQNILS